MRWIFLFFLTIRWSVGYAQSLHLIECQFPPQWNGKSAQVVYRSPEGRVFIDSTTIRNQQAFFDVNLPEPAPVYLWVEDRKQDTHLFLDSPRVDVLFPDTTGTTPHITGSPASLLWADFQLAEAARINELTELGLEAEEARQRQDATRASWCQRQADSIRSASIESVASYIRKNPSASLSWYLFATHYPLFRYQTALHLFKDLGAFSRLPSYASVQARLERKAVGQPAPDFTLPGRHGQTITRSRLKSKWLFIDFRFIQEASQPEQMADLRRLYETFRPKGLEIVSVLAAFGTTDFMWLINQRDLPWIQVLAQNDAYESLRTAYALERLPDNVLINAKGRIVARDCKIAELAAILQSN